MLQQTDATVSLKFKLVLQDVFDLNSSKCCIKTTASPDVKYINIVRGPPLGPTLGMLSH